MAMLPCLPDKLDKNMLCVNKVPSHTKQAWKSEGNGIIVFTGYQVNVRNSVMAFSRPCEMFAAKKEAAERCKHLPLSENK